MSKSDTQAKAKRNTRGPDFYINGGHFTAFDVISQVLQHSTAIAPPVNKSKSKPVPSLKPVEDQKPTSTGRGTTKKAAPPPSKKPKAKSDHLTSEEEVDSDIEKEVLASKLASSKSMGLSRKQTEVQEDSESEYELTQDQDHSNGEDSETFSVGEEDTDKYANTSLSRDRPDILRALGALEEHIRVGLDQFREDLLAAAKSPATVGRHQPKGSVPATRSKRKYGDLDGDQEDGLIVKAKVGAVREIGKGAKGKKIQKQPTPENYDVKRNWLKRLRKRRTTLSQIKERGIEGTELEHQDFRFLTDPHCQSTLHSDNEDEDQMCVVQPAWRSHTANKVSDALRLRGEKCRPSTSKPYFKPKRIYVLANTPIPVPGGNARIGIWAIDRAWRKQNPEAYGAAKHYIDMSQKAPDVRQLLSGTFPPERFYADRQPIPCHRVPHDVSLIGWKDKDLSESESS
ncbi:hypothetical protein FRC12_003053 [Ceratobasidium sp. 428]|nr:hypothetical protein FRC12_003053 [Ceratobasidium sp. 428]